MNFDKTKAMRSAERYVSQGKIRAAITEYRSVVDNDPRDIATLNMLGDLYAKNSDKRDAVQCYFQVADHYNAQGFAQKAIERAKRRERHDEQEGHWNQESSHSSSFLSIK